MKLTSYSNYARRSMHLAALKAPGMARIDDVARIPTLSLLHIVKIVHELGKAFSAQVFLAGLTHSTIGICVLTRKLHEATAAFLAVLDDLTIADIAASKGDLMERSAPLQVPRMETLPQ